MNRHGRKIKVYDPVYWRLNKMDRGWRTWVESGLALKPYEDVRLLAVT